MQDNTSQNQRQTVTEKDIIMGSTLIGNLKMLRRESDVKALFASNTPPVST